MTKSLPQCGGARHTGTQMAKKQNARGWVLTSEHACTREDPTFGDPESGEGTGLASR